MILLLIWLLQNMQPQIQTEQAYPNVLSSAMDLSHGDQSLSLNL